MTAQETLQRYEVTTTSVPCSRSNGLWSALVATTAPGSAAGSGLAGSSRPGQPISGRRAAGDDMFGYEADMADPMDTPAA
jgi:hypothetical protein